MGGGPGRRVPAAPWCLGGELETWEPTGQEGGKPWRGLARVWSGRDVLILRQRGTSRCLQPPISPPAAALQ